MSKSEENKKNPWITLSTKVEFETPWIEVSKHDVLNPAGKPGIYGLVNFKNLAIGVLALDQQLNTWLVGQWRYPIKQYSWEIPEGGGPIHEDPLLSAARELKEETGLVAKKYMELCRIHTSNSATNELAIIYLARELEQTESEPEETEELEVKKIPLQKAFEMVMNGEITDSLSMVAILKTKIMIDNGDF